MSFIFRNLTNPRGTTLLLVLIGAVVVFVCSVRAGQAQGVGEHLVKRHTGQFGRVLFKRQADDEDEDSNSDSDDEDLDHPAGKDRYGKPRPGGKPTDKPPGKPPGKPPMKTTTKPTTTKPPGPNKPHSTTKQPASSTKRPPPPTTKQPAPTTRKPQPTTKKPPSTTKKPPSTTKKPPPTTKKPPPTTRKPPATIFPTNIHLQPTVPMSLPPPGSVPSLLRDHEQTALDFLHAGLSAWRKVIERNNGEVFNKKHAGHFFHDMRSLVTMLRSDNKPARLAALFYAEGKP